MLVAGSTSCAPARSPAWRRPSRARRRRRVRTDAAACASSTATAGRCLFSLQGEVDPLAQGARALPRPQRSTATRPTSKTSSSPLPRRERAMLRSAVLEDAARQRDGDLVWWSLGLIGDRLADGRRLPDRAHNPDLNKMVKDYPEACRPSSPSAANVDYISAAGYLGSELFSFMVPLLLLIAAVGAGARAIAGEEERGTLDLLLANPVSRRRLVLEKLAALAAELAGLGSCSGSRSSSASKRSGWTSRSRTSPPRPASAALFAFVYGAIALCRRGDRSASASRPASRGCGRGRRLSRQLARRARRLLKPLRGLALLPLRRRRLRCARARTPSHRVPAPARRSPRASPRSSHSSAATWLREAREAEPAAAAAT